MNHIKRLEDRIGRQSKLLDEAEHREDKLTRENAELRRELADANSRIRLLTLELNRKPYTEMEP